MDKACILKKLEERKKMFEDYLRKNKEPARSTGCPGTPAAGPKKLRDRGSFKKGY